MNEVEKAIQEFEDNLYHKSLHPEISVESKVIALKILKEREMHSWLIDKFEKLKHDYAELKISEQSLRNSANGFKQENAELQSKLSKAVELLGLAEKYTPRQCDTCAHWVDGDAFFPKICEVEGCLDLLNPDRWQWRHAAAMRELMGDMNGKL